MFLVKIAVVQKKTQEISKANTNWRLWTILQLFYITSCENINFKLRTANKNNFFPPANYRSLTRKQKIQIQMKLIIAFTGEQFQYLFIIYFFNRFKIFFKFFNRNLLLVAKSQNRFEISRTIQIRFNAEWWHCYRVVKEIKERKKKNERTKKTWTHLTARGRKKNAFGKKDIGGAREEKPKRGASLYLLFHVHNGQ